MTKQALLEAIWAARSTARLRGTGCAPSAPGTLPLGQETSETIMRAIEASRLSQRGDDATLVTNDVIELCALLTLIIPNPPADVSDRPGRSILDSGMGSLEALEADVVLARFVAMHLSFRLVGSWVREHTESTCPAMRHGSPCWDCVLRRMTDLIDVGAFGRLAVSADTTECPACATIPTISLGDGLRGCTRCGLRWSSTKIYGLDDDAEGVRGFYTCVCRSEACRDMKPIDDPEAYVDAVANTVMSGLTEPVKLCRVARIRALARLAGLVRARTGP